MAFLSASAFFLVRRRQRQVAMAFAEMPAWLTADMMKMSMSFMNSSFSSCDQKGMGCGGVVSAAARTDSSSAPARTDSNSAHGPAAARPRARTATARTAQQQRARAHGQQQRARAHGQQQRARAHGQQQRARPSSSAPARTAQQQRARAHGQQQRARPAAARTAPAAARTASTHGNTQCTQQRAQQHTAHLDHVGQRGIDDDGGVVRAGEGACVESL